jgi:transketolase
MTGFINKDKLVMLQKKACQLRMDTIKTYHHCALQTGHVGGCLSAAEIVTALYYEILRQDPKNPKWEDRDRFILSKGHNSMIVYCALADLGYFPKSELDLYRTEGSILQTHPDADKCPGIEMSTGSLGQGLSLTLGMALAARVKKNPCKYYTLMSDGELQSGMVWEAAMAAGHFKMDSMICFVDRNNLQVNGKTDWIMEVEPLEEKWRSFGWRTFRIDGHDFISVLSAVYLANQTKGKPTIIICDTVKAKGVSFMEGKNLWHGAPIDKDSYTKGRVELVSDLEKKEAAL